MFGSAGALGVNLPVPPQPQRRLLMPVTTSHPPGTFSWIDLAAHDVDAAERYYTRLFGWTAERMPFGPEPDDVYVMLKKEGRDAAAMYSMDPTQKSQGMPSAWLSYVT